MVGSRKKEKDGELEAGIWIETKKADSQTAMLERKFPPAGTLCWGPTEANWLAMHIFSSENIWGAVLWLTLGSQSPT